MATTEEELKKKLTSSNAERLGRSVRKGVDSLGGNIAGAGKAVANTVAGVGAGIGTAATLAGNELKESVGAPLGDFARGFTGSTPSPVTASPNQRNQAAAGFQRPTVTEPTDISRGFTTQESTGFSQSVPTADEITKSIAFNESQRRQGGQGFQGATTGDSSGTGVQADRSPLGVIPDRVSQQLSANRGFNTQLTQLGATAGDGTQLASRGGTFSSVGSSRTPQQQLASLRETFGSPKGQSNTGGFGIAPNSYTRERNARLRDPSNRLLSDLQSQVRSGQISARAAGGIAATLLGQQQDATTARERLASQANQFGQEIDLKREQATTTNQIAREKLASEAQSSALDRETTALGLGAKAEQTAAKLGLDYAELGERQRANLASEDVARDRLRQQEMLGIAGIAQREQASVRSDQTARLGQLGQSLKAQLEGVPTDLQAQYLGQLLSPEVARQFFSAEDAQLYFPIEE